ncbi:hypothetical protein ACROYT_G032812 [Oculina patagonica]
MASVSDEERDKKRYLQRVETTVLNSILAVRSPIQVGNSIKREARNVASEVEAECEIKKARIDEKEARVSVRESEVIEKERQIQEVEEKYATARVETEKLERQKETVAVELKDKEKQLDTISKEYEKLKVLLEQKQNAKARRMNTATTFEMVNNPHSSTRYRRRQETKNILEFIHGGEEGSIYGAWDYLQSNATKDQMEKFIGSYKRGRFLQGVFGRAMKEYGNSEEALKQAVAMKYQAFLSITGLPPSSKFTGTHLYTWMERGTAKVKCLAQQHNTASLPGPEPWPFDSESSALTIRPPSLPLKKIHESTVNTPCLPGS